RPCDSALLAACGAKISRSRCSSCSRNVVMLCRGARDASAALGEQVPQKARAVRQAADAKELGQRLPEVGERRARAEIVSAPDMPPHRDDRHELARVIRA